MSIYVTGDTHIPINIHKLNTTNFPEQKQLTKNDYLIICGDFGGVWDKSKEEQYWLQWLNQKSFTTLFVDGNHENFNLLNSYPVEIWHGGKIHRIKENVIHLMRGQVFEIGGKKIFTMGGASSHDKEYRKEGISWWDDEMPKKEEYDEAINNLDKHMWAADLVITHCAASSVQRQIADCYKCDKLTDFLEIVRQELDYQQWYFGHYHIDKNINNKNIVIYNNIEKIIV